MLRYLELAKNKKEKQEIPVSANKCIRAILISNMLDDENFKSDNTWRLSTRLSDRRF